MKLSHRLKIFAASLLLAMTGTVSGAQKNPWNFEVGVGTRSLTPLVLLGGVSYKSFDVRIQGLGFHNGPRDFWCGMRGSLLWTPIKDDFFQISLGFGSGYEYAQAPNDLHKAVNEANHAKYLLPYNFKENFDVSGEVWASILGLYTQISVPVYRFRNHDMNNNLLWGVGYMYKF